jgi:hypothetical protein
MKRAVKFSLASLIYFGASLFPAGLIMLIAFGDCGAALTLTDRGLCIHQQQQFLKMFFAVAVLLWPLVIGLLWRRIPHLRKP